MLCSKLVFKDARWTLATSVTLAVLSFNVLASEDNLSPEQVLRGAYLLRAAGCVACHTDYEHGGTLLAGGRALKTSFGTFFTPNITANPKYGIGNWNKHDFITAMTRGISPDGTHYYPVFPYTAYSGITADDLSDLWAYLRTVPLSRAPNRKHDVKFPFSI